MSPILRTGYYIENANILFSYQLQTTLFFYLKMSQPEAEKYCEQNGFKLASIKSVEEQAIILEMARGKTINGNRKLHT